VVARKVARLIGSMRVGRIFPIPQDSADMLRCDLIAAGLPLSDKQGHRLVYHSLRHTAPTWLMSNGVPLQHVMAITGHKSIHVLMKHYGHLQLEQAEEALKSMPVISVEATA
jgi:integrase